MNPRNLTDLSRDILMFCVQFAVLFACIGFIGFLYEEDIAPDKKVAEEFGVSSCNILAKSMGTSGKMIHRYRAEFLVNYLAGSAQYKSVASANGLDYSYTTNMDSQQEFLDEFEVGNQYPCWYDPSRPNIVVLVLRHNWTSTFPLIVPSAIALIMLYYIFRSAFLLLEAWVRMRNNNKR
jgi:hypothetical protein